MKQFQAESKKLLEMMIHSIYTNKDVFLRELISNASDALDKRYLHDLSANPSGFDRSQYKIELIPDEAQRTLTVRDNGIGMNEEELDRFLGTIAHSGSEEFRTAQGQEDLAHIIGQFGVGFYASFMVADRVEVKSKPLSGEAANLWTSNGTDGYEITPIDKKEVGTEVILHLKADGEEEDYSKYLNEYTLRSLVERYSNYIRYSIEMTVQRQKRVMPPEDADEATKKEAEDHPTYETVDEVLTLNSKTPIWEKAKKDLKAEDYIQFYQQEGLGYDTPLRWIHMVADGTLSYRAILYIPASLPWDFYGKDFKKGLTLYSAGVKIMDHADQLLPDYLGFVQGVVSSEDFHLNLSRETLQEDRQILAISRRIEKRVLEELAKMMAEDRPAYRSFFHLFGTTLKAGIYQSYGAKKNDLAPLLLFDTSKGEGRSLAEILQDQFPAGESEGEGGQKAAAPAASDQAEGTASEARTSDQAEEQAPDAPKSDADSAAEPSKLYYATGESTEAISKLPTVQYLKEKGVEVLYLPEMIDEFTIKAMQDFEGHPFQSVLSDDFHLPEEADEKEASENTEAQPLFESIQETLGNELAAVKAGRNLREDAAILTAQGEISIEMEKAFAAQPGDHPEMKAEKVLQLNVNHPVVQKMIRLQKEGQDEEVRQYAHLLYDQARLIAGLPIDDPVAFARAVQKRM